MARRKYIGSGFLGKKTLRTLNGCWRLHRLIGIIFCKRHTVVCVPIRSVTVPRKCSEQCCCTCMSVVAEDKSGCMILYALKLIQFVVRDTSKERITVVYPRITVVYPWVLVSVIAVFWATIPNPTRPRVADSGTPYRYIG